MKTITISLCYFLFLNKVFCQHTIALDFNCANLSSAQEIKMDDINEGDFFIIRITNINLNLYKVSITTKDTVLSKPQVLPTFGNIDLDALSKAFAGLSPINTSVSQISQPVQTLDGKGLAQRIEFAPSNDNEKLILDSMDKNLAYLKTANQNLNDIVLTIDELKLRVYKLRLNSLMLNNPTTEFDFTTALNDVERIRTNILTLKSSIEDNKLKYEKISKEHQPIILSKPVLVTNDKKIKDLYSQIIAANSELFSSISADKTLELLLSIVLIQNNSSNIYTSLPIQFLGEQTKVKITITPREDKFNLQSYSTQITYPDKIQRYSVVGLSFYQSWLRDSTYSVINTLTSDTTSSYSFVAEDGINTEVGIAALLHYGGKFNNSDLGAHFAIGVGVPISNKFKPRLLMGGGLSYGGKHMVTIDGGLIIGYVDRLSSAINLTQSYTEIPENISVSKLAYKNFFSIGYIYQF